jgi:S1-C subfamily serine protease
MAVMWKTFKGSFLYQVDDENITEMYTQVPTNGLNKHSALIRLSRDGYFFCSGVVIDGNYALTAAHCLTNTFGFMEKEDVEISNEIGINTGVIAKPVAIDKLRDIALIKGQFIDFESVPVDFSGAVQKGMERRPVLSCGFPSGGPRYCSLFYITGNTNFQLRAYGGMLYKGQSGGPVVDLYSKNVIGVNSAVTEDDVIFAPVVGAAEIFGIQ